MILNCQDQADSVWYVTKTRQDNDMSDHIGVVYVEIKIELPRLIEQDAFYHENEIRQWRDRSYSVIFIEYDIEMSWLIGQCVVYDKDEIGQRRDQSYKTALRWKEI